MSSENRRNDIARIIANAIPFENWPQARDAPENTIFSPDVFELPDPTTLPLRQWLYGGRLIRGRVSMTLAPGGLGKSGLTMGEAVVMATGKGFLGEPGPDRPLRVWLWNLEDPEDELIKRLTAICMHFGILQEDIGNRLLTNCVDDELVITHTDRSGTAILQPVVNKLVQTLKTLSIDVLVIDPFVSCHDASENDNSIMDRIAKTWARVALEANCAVELVHHSRKLNGASVTTDASRGASAVTNAARNVRTLNPMKREDEDKAGVENHRRYFNAINDKANLSPPAEHLDWYQLVSVYLGNGQADLGDSVGVVAKWKWPDAAEGLTSGVILKSQHAVTGGKYRENSQAKDWAGHKIGEVLEIDTSDPFGKNKVKSLMKSWTKNKLLKVIYKRENGKNVPYVDVGEWMR